MGAGGSMHLFTEKTEKMKVVVVYQTQTHHPQTYTEG